MPAFRAWDRQRGSSLIPAQRARLQVYSAYLSQVQPESPRGLVGYLAGPLEPRRDLLLPQAPERVPFSGLVGADAAGCSLVPRAAPRGPAGCPG